MERKTLILLVIVVVAAQMICKSSADDECYIMCGVKCVGWSNPDICFKPCCKCCDDPSCRKSPPTSKRLDSSGGEKLH